MKITLSKFACFVLNHCLVSFTAFARRHTRQHIFPFTAVHFLCATYYVLACVVFIATAIAVSACGIPWVLPETPMDSDNRFQHWEILGVVPLGANRQVNFKKNITEIPIHLGFAPASNFPSLLGAGWSLPIFESRIEWLNANSAKIFLPDGYSVFLQRDSGKKERLSGNTWIAEINGRQTVCQASCGWRLTFQDNRLVSMKTPDDITMELSSSPGYLRKLTLGTQTLISLKSDYDPRTTLKVYRLKYGKEEILFKTGYRPSVVKRNKKTEKIGKLESLSSIQFNVEPEEKYEFTLESFAWPDRTMKNNGRPVRNKAVWDRTSFVLTEYDGNRYEDIVIHGIKCRKITSPDGRTSILGKRGKEIIVAKGRNDPAIYLTENFVGGILDGKIRKNYIVHENNQRELVEFYTYDDNGKILNALFNKEIYTYNAESLIVMDASRKKQLWLLKFDEKNNINEFQTPRKIYRIERGASKSKIFIFNKEMILLESIFVENYQVDRLFQRIHPQNL